MLAEVVVARDGLSAEVAHEAAAAARHPVAALRLDQARPALDALPHPSCRHALLAAAQGTRTGRVRNNEKESKEKETGKKRMRESSC